MANQTAKKLICLWKGCDLVFDEETAFQEHVISKHVHEQHQLSLTNQESNDGTVMAAAEEPMAKKAKMDHDDEDNKMINGGRKRSIYQSKFL